MSVYKGGFYMQQQILLKTEKLCKTFSNGGQQQHVLKNIDLELYQGDFTVIMGASGAGKSTLLYALSGMDTPSLGTITFGDKVISNLSQDGLAVFRREHCGFVFQQIYLIDGMSVMDNVLSAGLLVNKDKKAVVSRAKELFAAVDISEETQKKFPTQISGGEAQRVGIVRALINNPEILFADEPTGALNSKTGLDVLDTLTKFNEQGQSVVMVTHDMRSARRGNRILYLKDGVILGECNLGKYTHGDTARHEKLTAFLKEMGW
jgi:putative ABC transport system ATP-binding protein